LIAMSVAAIMEVWSEAHKSSDPLDSLRLSIAVQQNLLAEDKIANAKMKGIIAKLSEQISKEVAAYSELLEGNFFVALGGSITNRSSDKDVKKAYRKLALKHHPDRQDKTNCPGADVIFPMIQNAYEEMQDGEFRRKYRPAVFIEDAKRKVKKAGASSGSGSGSGSCSGGTKSSNESWKKPRDYGEGTEKRHERQQRAKKQQEEYRRYREDFERQQWEEKANEAEAEYQRQNDYQSYQRQQHEKKKKEQFKKRMEEIRREKERRFQREQAEQEKRKAAQREAEENARKRKQEKAEREAKFRKQQAELEKLNELKRIVRIDELRGLKSGEIRERLKAIVGKKGIDLRGLCEKEDFVKKYLLVTGQEYRPAAASGGGVGNDDGRETEHPGVDQDTVSLSVFRSNVKKMKIKELRAFIIKRGGIVDNIVEKTDLIEEAIRQYNPVVRKKFGRSMFGAGMDDDAVDDENDVSDDGDDNFSYANAGSHITSPTKKKFGRTMFGAKGDEEGDEDNESETENEKENLNTPPPIIKTSKLRDLEARMGHLPQVGHRRD